MKPASAPDPDEIRIRDARQEDAGAVALLLGQLGYPSSVEDASRRVREALGDPACEVFVAWAGGEILGLASTCVVPYFPDGSRILRVTALVVAEQARRRGVGAALLARARESARRQHCSGVELTTAERRSGAHAFYEQMGFRRTAYRFFQVVESG